jgi:hypothetical protein
MGYRGVAEARARIASSVYAGHQACCSRFDRTHLSSAARSMMPVATLTRRSQSHLRGLFAVARSCAYILQKSVQKGPQALCRGAANSSCDQNRTGLPNQSLGEHPSSGFTISFTDQSKKASNTDLRIGCTRSMLSASPRDLPGNIGDESIRTPARSRRSWCHALSSAPFPKEIHRHSGRWGRTIDRRWNSQSRSVSGRKPVVSLSEIILRSVIGRR